MTVWVLPAMGADAAPAAAATGPAPAAPATSSPEQTVQDTLTAYLQRMQPTRLDDIAALNLSRDQVTARIQVFEQTSRYADLADTYLYYLTKFPPDPKDYLKIFASLNRVLAQHLNDDGLLTLTFELADTFPPGADEVQQIRLAQAQYLLSVGGPEAALAVLNRVANQPEASATMRMQAAGTAGFLHERMGQVDEAIAAYRLAGQDVKTGPAASEALLRATFMLLQLGRTDEALDTLAKLRGAPAEMLGPADGPVIKDLLSLAEDPAHAREYWEHQKAWLPQWVNLAGAHGIFPQPSSTVIAAYIDNYPQLAAQANAALRQQNAGLYFQVLDALFQSGRWRPNDLADAANLLYQGMALAPAQADDIFALGEALEKGLGSADQNLLEQLTQYRVAALMDHDKVPQARDTAQAMLEKFGSDGESGQALARLFGLAVLRSSSVAKYGPEAAKILTATLADPAAHGNQRMLAVAVLSDLDTGLGRDEEARAMLEKELAQPPNPNDPNSNNRQVLQTALDNLRQRALQGAGLEAGLSIWWQEHALPWYSYTISKPQAGPLSTVDEPAVEVARDFNRALDKDSSLTVRVVSLESAWVGYPEMFSNTTALMEGAKAFITRPEMPLDMRYLAWMQTEIHLYFAGQREAAEQFMALMPSGSETAADDRADFQLWDDYLAQPDTVEAQQAFAEKIIALPAVRHSAMMLMGRIFNALASLGAVEAAQADFAKLGEAKLVGMAAQDYLELNGTAGPMLDTYKAVFPVAEALRQIILDAQPAGAAPAQLPAAWQGLNDTLEPNLSLLTQDEVRQGLYYYIVNRLPYGSHPLQVFFDYAETLSFNAADSAERMKLFETAQKLATRDADRFIAACFFTAAVDFDNPEVAKQGWVDLAPARDAAFPRAAGFIQYYDTLMKWRSGQPVDPAADFGPLDAPNFDPFKLRLLLDYYLQQNDRANLQKVLDARKEEDLLKQPVLGGYVKALRLLNKAAALTRATDAARAEAAKAVVASWARPDMETIEPIFDLARALNDPKIYPREWITALLGLMRNENSRDLVRMEDARLQGDWAGALDAVTSYLSRNPTNYDAYWIQTQALVQLNRRAEALAPLRLYVKYSHNDDYYPEAVALLKKLEAEAAAKSK
jgi:hypothetical protein